MNEVKKAFAISDEHKIAALWLYAEAVKEMVHKDYVAQVHDAHTDLSAIFGTRWLYTQRKNGRKLFAAASYAEANNAFNYANCVCGFNGGFEKLAKQVVEASERVSDERLAEMQQQMNYLLTCTTAEAFEKGLAA